MDDVVRGLLGIVCVALVAVLAYGGVAVVVVARALLFPPHHDVSSDELDRFIAEVLGPRDQVGAVVPARSWRRRPHRPSRPQAMVPAGERSSSAGPGPSGPASRA